MDSTASAPSWADMVRTIDKERKELPWDKTTAQPVHRESTYERKKNERNFNPVTMKFRDPAKENNYLAVKREKENDKLTHVKSTMNSTFNIVSHIGPPRKADALFASMSSKKMPNRREYNLMTNLSHSDHNAAPFQYDESYHLTRAGVRKSDRAQTAANGRPFNLVNNHFIHDHDRKKQEEYEQMKDHLLKKYWETHDYDLIRGKYCNPEKEKDFCAQRKQLELVQGTSQLQKIPPSIKYSEGNSFNIVTHNAYDEGRLRATTTIADRSLNRIKRLERDKYFVAEGEKVAEVAEKKSMARISFKRWEQQLDRGFDMVKNTVITEQPHPLPVRPSTMWSRLKTTEELEQRALGADGNRNTGSAVPSNRVRNLSGAGPRYAPTSERVTISGGPAGTPLKPRANAGTGYEDSGNSKAADPISLPAMSSFDNVSNFQRLSTDSSAYQGMDGTTARSDASGSIYNLNSVRSGRSLAAERTESKAADGTASRGNGGNNNKSRGLMVPSLDLSQAEPPEPVSYVEPMVGAKGASVAMVRTGGFSNSFRG